MTVKRDYTAKKMEKEGRCVGSNQRQHFDHLRIKLLVDFVDFKCGRYSAYKSYRNFSDYRLLQIFSLTSIINKNISSSPNSDKIRNMSEALCNLCDSIEKCKHTNFSCYVKHLPPPSNTISAPRSILSDLFGVGVRSSLEDIDSSTANSFQAAWFLIGGQAGGIYAQIMNVIEAAIPISLGVSPSPPPPPPSPPSPPRPPDCDYRSVTNLDDNLKSVRISD